MTEDDYITLIDQRISDLGAAHAHRQPIDAMLCVVGITERRPPIAKLREYCVNILRIKAAEFDRALQRQVTEAQLGRYPDNASDFVKLIVGDLAIAARYNGVLTMDAKPFVEGDDGEKVYFEPADRPDLASVVSTHFRRNIEFQELQERLRLRATELALPFRDSILNDASRAWYRHAKRDRLQHILALVSHEQLDDVERQNVLHDFSLLVRKCFDDTTHSIDFIVAVLLKYIHQVKRKMHGLEVSRHLMPILMGKTGCGKTTLVRALIEPLGEVAADTDFKQIADERVIDMWLNFVLFVDEMGWSTKAEANLVKYIISAKTLDRRRMQQNHTDRVAQNATLIGTSNQGSVSVLFHDVTGLRRYAGLYTKNRMDWQAINAMDWLKLWQCISPDDPDPILPFVDDLANHQEEERAKSSVEAWLEDTDWYCAMSGLVRQRTKFTGQELYEEFRNYEERNFPRQDTNKIAFGRELGRLSRLDIPEPYFKRATNSEGTCWEWVREKPQASHGNKTGNGKENVMPFPHSMVG